MSRNKSSLIGGVAILSIAGILTKVIGMFFRVPLTNTIGSSGLGVFTTVYNNYTLLLTVSTAGIPVGISRLVSESVSQHKNKQAKSILRTAVILLSIVGLLFTVLLIAFARPIAARIATEQEYIGFVVIAPSILIVSLMSAFRGYMQGRQYMVPTAISQLLEAIAKVVISFPLAIIGLRTSSIYAAAGALLGITIGEAIAFVYMVIMYIVKYKSFHADKAEDAGDITSFSVHAKQLISIALPITIGSMIVPLSGTIDTILVRSRLVAAGFTEDKAVSLLGLLNGSTLSLVNLPTVLATAVCISLVPIISVARLEKRTSDMHAYSTLGLRLASLIGFPCMIGMSMLATPIIKLLYNLPMEEILVTGEILSISALTILFFCQVQATTGILQGAGLQKIPMYSLVFGVGVKIILDYILIGIPSINIFGSPIASIVCYGISFFVNLYFIIRKTDLKMDWSSVLLRPGAATLGMAAVVLIAMQVLNMNSRLFTLLTVAIGGMVYVYLVFACKVLKREDMDQIPGGDKLEKLMIKLHVWH